jgi:protein TonB
MTRTRPSSRVAGWLLAGASSLALIGGAAAFALAAERQVPVLFLDLASLPPAAPSIAAVAEAAPEVAATPPPAPEVPDAEEAEPVVPDEVTAPTLAAAASPALPEVDRTVTADIFLPPPRPEPEPKPEPKSIPETTPEKKPEPEKKAAAEKKPDKKKSEKTAKAAETPVEHAAPDKKATPAAEASAPNSGSKVKGGAVSAAAYAKAVLKKVRSTKKKSGAGKGTVVVGFSIAADGGLAGVQVLQTSGNAALDRIAVDHIRRSVPFPAPPPSAAGSGYSFEFVGK